MSGTYLIRRTYCPACHSPHSHQLYSCNYTDQPIKEFLYAFYASQGGIEYEYLEDATYTLLECEECQTVYQQDIPDPFLMQKLYSEWISPHQDYVNSQQTHDLTYYTRLAEEVMMVVAYLGNRPDRLKVFDFGMGWGNWCRMAQAFGCTTYGTELDLDKTAYAQSFGINVLSWDDIATHRFDFINTEQVFEHVADPLDMLCHLKQALKPGGLMKLSVPYGGDIKRRLKVMDWMAPKGSYNSLNPVSPLEHINCYQRQSLIKMAERAGLEPVTIPLHIWYAAMANWMPVIPMLKNIGRPFHRMILCKGSYEIFRIKQPRKTG